MVCMPTYHSKMEWLERAVKSLKLQTYTNFKVMAVKDGCPLATGPNTCRECENCRETADFFNSLGDERFFFFNLPVKCGAAGWGPRNFAILNSDHDLFAYLDDDNWYEPEHLESLISLMDEDAEMAYTGTRLWNTELKVIGERIHPAAPKAGYIDTSEMIHKRSLIHRYGGWRFVPKCNDWDIVSRWVDVKWRHTGKVTLNFYVREGCGIHRE